MASITQVVSATGEFETGGVMEFVKASGVESSGVDYTVVAIMGPQSSGKSTLLNTVFGTGFTEMNALEGRQQTTKGIWLSRAPKVAAPTTLVMDLEGCDGRERGEDDTSFERQSALFALATADVVLVNMWAKDVGRETGAGKPLLKTIFQVNLKLFQPAPGRRRTVLLFVFRDRTRTPLELLTSTWEADLARMWGSIAKPPQYEASSFNDFFEVKYAALSNYEERPEDFAAEALLLRRRFAEDDADTFLRPSGEKLPGHALALSMAKVWEVVREHKDLNLPAHRVMVANIRCAEIAREQLDSFAADQAWVALADEAAQDLVPGFGALAAGLMDSCVTGYEEEARYFDPGVSAARCEALSTELRAAVRPVFDGQCLLLRALCLDAFRASLAAPGITAAETFVAKSHRCTADALEQFDAGASDLVVPAAEDWDTNEARVHLAKELSSHVAAVRDARAAEVTAEAAREAAAAVGAEAVSLFEAPPTDLWPRLDRALERALVKGGEMLTGGLRGLGLNAHQAERYAEQVAAAAQGRLLSHAREAANTALSRIKDRFNEVFQRDDAGMPRNWPPSADVPAVTAAARAAAARLLAQLAVVRMAGGVPGAATAATAVEVAVLRMAAAREGAAAAAAAAAGGELDVLSAVEWPGVERELVLLSPPQCRTIWRQFVSDSNFAVQQALATQQANRAAQNRLPPLWAVAAMVVLGANEAVAVLRNPLYLVLLLVLFLFLKTIYQELDVEGEMARGLLPGVLSLSTKFVPTVKRVALRTFESAWGLLQDAPEAQQQRRGDEQDEAPGGAATGGGVRQRRREVELQASSDRRSSGERAAGVGRKDN